MADGSTLCWRAALGATLLLLAACATPGGPRSAQPVSQEDPVLAQRFDAYFAPWANSKDVSGTLRVERAGVPVLVRHYGYADWNHRAPHTDLTRYSAASVTKGIVAATLVKLARDGTLSLDDPVARWLPVLRHHPDMTLREVLHHRAGLPRDLPDDDDPRHEDVARWLARHPEQFEAAGTEHYSNVGYALLAEVVAGATG